MKIHVVVPASDQTTSSLSRDHISDVSVIINPIK